MAKDNSVMSDAHDDTAASSKEKGIGKFRRGTPQMITVDDAVVDSAPASTKHSSFKTRQLGPNKFSSNLDRANSSMKEDPRVKQGIDSKIDSQPTRFSVKEDRESQAPSSATKNK